MSAEAFTRMFRVLQHNTLRPAFVGVVTNKP
jgi:hypothetical protein